MSVNSSSSFNASLAPSTPSPPINIFLDIYECFNTTVGTSCITVLTITVVLLLLPLYIFVLYLGIQRWRQQRSGMKMTHSDLFTYHMVLIELISVLGFTLCCCGVHTDHLQVTAAGIYLCTINLTGQMCLHILTCVDRYLAVVHPVTYLSLKKSSMIGTRIVGFVWLSCIASTSLMSSENRVFTVIVAISILFISIAVIAFCSLSVLCVLIRPGPGDGCEGRQRVDKSKLRAFYTIAIILGVLLVKFLGNMFALVLYASSNLGDVGMCGVWMSVFWFSLPSCPVLPLLFFQRAGKLLCCKSGDGSD